MKRAILLFAVIFAYITPTYSQLNRQSETGVKSEHFQNKKNHDFRIYKFDKFSDFLSNRGRDIFNISPTTPAPGSSQGRYIQGSNMPCFHPKSGDKMPCLEPNGTFHMRVFKPTDSSWGMLWESLIRVHLLRWNSA